MMLFKAVSGNGITGGDAGLNTPSIMPGTLCTIALVVTIEYYATDLRTVQMTNTMPMTSEVVLVTIAICIWSERTDGKDPM